MSSSKNFLKDLSTTFVVQIIVTISGIILLRLLSQNLTEDVFGIYLVIRRFIALAFPLITLNLSMSLARFISFNSNKSGFYFFNSVILCTIIFLLLLILLPFYKSIFSNIIFGSKLLQSLVFPTLLFLFASSFQVLCVGLFRGLHDFIIMNFVNIIYWIEAIIVLLSIMYFKKSTLDILTTFLFIYSIISIVTNCLIVLFRKVKFRPLEYLREIFSNSVKGILASRFLKYGFNRLPSGFFIAGIFFIPVFAASSSISLKTAAFIGIIVSIMRMVQLLGIPFNLLFLPKFSSLQSTGDSHVIRKHSQMVLNYIFTLPLIFGAFISFLSREIIIIWFGSSYEVVVPYMQIAGLFLVFFLSYILIRGILDGISNYPFVNIITLVSFIIIALTSALVVILSYNLIGLTLALCISLFSLGILSIYYIRKLQNLRITYSKNIVAFAWFILLSLSLFLINKYLVLNSIVLLLLMKLLIIGILTTISLIIYRSLKFEWLIEIISRFSSARLS